MTMPDSASVHQPAVAIMQPYFFPYFGYFQLIGACELFVVRDEAQYIRQGWVNRNRILGNGGARWITLPIAAADHRLAINRREYLLDHRLAARLRDRISSAYRGAPHFGRTMQVVDDVLSYRDSNVATFNVHSLRCVAKALEIDTPMRLASGVASQPS